MWVYSQNGQVTEQQRNTKQHTSNNTFAQTPASENLNHYSTSQKNNTFATPMFDVENIRFSDKERAFSRGEHFSVKERTPVRAKHFSQKASADISQPQQAQTSISADANTAMLAENLISAEKTKTKIHTVFFGAYLVGAIVAGLIFGFLSEESASFFTLFVKEHFEFLSISNFTTLLLYNIWLPMLSLTVIFLFGLCALGTPLLLLFFTIKGLADSIILITYFLSFGAENALDYLLLFGLHNIVSLLFFFLLASTASKNAALLFNYTCVQKVAKANKIFKKLRGQYLFFLTMSIALAFLIASLKTL